MTDPVDPAAANPKLRPSPVGPTSRYVGVGVSTYPTTDGREVAYLQRRIVPPPEAFTTVVEHEVAPGERLDQLAARYFGDASLAWRIADANGALDPSELEVPGRVLRITLGDSVPGGTP